MISLVIDFWYETIQKLSSSVKIIAFSDWIFTIIYPRRSTTNKSVAWIYWNWKTQKHFIRSFVITYNKKFTKFTEFEKFNLSSWKKLKYFYNELTISHICFITINFIKRKFFIPFASKYSTTIDTIIKFWLISRGTD
jgi:hypothetical protein